MLFNTFKKVTKTLCLLFVTLLAVQLFINLFFVVGKHVPFLTPQYYVKALLNPIPDSVTEIRCAKDFSGYGATACSFEAEQKDIEKIITENNLQEDSNLDAKLLVLMKKFEKYPWWESVEDLKKIKIYHQIQDANKFVFVNEQNNKVYFLKV